MLWSYAMGSRGPSSISSTCESRWCPYLPAWIASLPTSLLGALSLSHSPSPSSSMPTEVSGALAPNRARLSVQSYKSCARLHRGGDRLPVCLPGMQSTALQALALGVQSTPLAVLTQRRASALTGKVREGCCRGRKELAVTGNQWRKHAPVQILALVAEYRERVDEQVVVLFQVLAAEINFGYKFQTVRLSLHPLSVTHTSVCECGFSQADA